MYNQILGYYFLKYNLLIALSSETYKQSQIPKNLQKRGCEGFISFTTPF
jgi:hypothetical protein